MTKQPSSAWPKVKNKKPKQQSKMNISPNRLGVSVKSGNNEDPRDNQGKKPQSTSQVKPHAQPSQVGPENHLPRDRDQLSSSDSSVIPQSISCSQHVGLGTSTSEGSASNSSSGGGHQPLHPGSIGRDENRVRFNPCGQDFPAHVGGRAGVDHMVCEKVGQIQQVGSPFIPTLCGTTSSTTRGLEGNGTPDFREGPDSIKASARGDPKQECSQGPSQESGSSINYVDPTNAGDSQPEPRAGRGVRVSSSGVGGNRGTFTSERASQRRCTGTAVSHAEFGECSPAGDFPFAGPDCSRETQSRGSLEDTSNEWSAYLAAGDPDWEHGNKQQPEMCRERKAYVRALLKISQELDGVQQQFQGHTGERYQLFEVFCGPQSRLTQQVINLGCKACRFALPQVDLMTVEGRRELFVKLMMHRPEHVWFSPECGPWSAWSNFNQSRSCQAWETIQAQRIGNMEQLALGIVIMRYQRETHNHFHWEQPQRSNMFRSPVLQELYCQTLAAEFDMCQVGALRDPESNLLIKKGMTIMTTSKQLHGVLHGRYCNRDHEHQTLEGTTRVQGKSMSRTRFSESYPRKFARSVAQVIGRKHGTHDHPINLSQEVFAVSPEGPSPKRPRLSMRAKAARPAESREIQKEGQDGPEKRRRITGKGGSIPSSSPPVVSEASMDKVVWQKVLDEIKPQLPRVGRKDITHPKILDQIQQLIHPKKLHSIVAGKGLNRTTAPLVPTSQGEAPFRMLVYIHRDTGVLEGIGQWEKWDTLPRRQIVRPGFPARVAMTVFAANPPMATNSQGHEASVPAEPVSSQGSIETTIPRPLDKVEQGASTEEVVLDRITPGPLFLQLSQEDQQLLMKIHKNAGHPGADKLAYLLKQQGFRPEMIAAVADLKCAACDATRGPRISRPSAIHSPCDFNDSISMDGYTWTNKAGKLFHFYHIIDYSTNFHVAKFAPNRSVENAIQCFQQAWLSWAGSPNELLVDAASELNAEAFSLFSQQNNIKCTTISTEAHWQNGRAERHGAILGNMLTKSEVEEPINTGNDFEQMLIHCTQAKNSLSIRKGYPPEVLVLGKSTRIPGSICSDHQLPAHALADSETCHGLVFRSQLARREIARKAFHAADNDQALRRAIVRRSRPARAWYNPGEWVMIWGGGNNPGWRGPMKVVQQESNQTIWVTQHGKLYRPAPEHVRPVTAIESTTIDPLNAPSPNLPTQQKPPDEVQGSRESETPVTEIPTTANINGENHSPENENTIEVGQSQESSDTEPMSEPPQSENHQQGQNANAQPSSGINIPVPSSETEEEIMVGLYCHDEESPNIIDQDHIWKSEILIVQQDIENWQAEETPAETAFLATAAKRQRSEVKLQSLDENSKALFEKAKFSEINNWLSTQTVKRIFRHQIPEDQILRCRWLLSWKPIDPTDQQEQGTHKAKARLVVLGYLDPQLEEIPRDSPTMSKTSRMLVLQLIASKGWELMSFDIKAAFLQGQPQSSRVLGLEPVPELRKALQLRETEICQLVKGAYGLVDAPYLWYKTLQAELLSLGFVASPFDPCVFLLWDSKHQKPQGILGIHVDDGLCGGNENFHEKVRLLEKKYPFGSRKIGSFTFTGIELHQGTDKSIVLSQSSYIRKIPAIQISPQRKDQETAVVSEIERQQLRGLIGSLQFASVNTRPDLASRLSNLQSQINSATVSTLMQANRTLHEAKRHHDVTITIQAIEMSQVRFLSFSDASFASKKVPTSQAGNIILATHKRIEENITCPVSPMSWGSKKIQRVVTSTLAAETMSLSSSLDQLSWVRLYWHWFQCPNDEWKHPIETLQRLPKAITSMTLRHPDIGEATSVVDCKSLYDLVTRTAPPNCQEFRTQLQAQAIKEQLAEGVGVRWVHSGAQLADSLTKIMESNFLRETLRRGHYKLNDEQEVLKDRASARNRLKWLKDNTSQET